MFSVLIILIISLKSVVTVDISVNVQFGGASDSSSCGNKDSFTATNQEELREKLAQKLESVLLKNQDDFVTISSHFRYNNEFHSTDLTKLDLLTTSKLSTAATSDASTSALSNTDNFDDYTLATNDDVTGSLATATGNDTANSGSDTEYITKTDKASKYSNISFATSVALSTFNSTTPKKYQTTGRITSIGTEHTTLEADKISSTYIESFTAHTAGNFLLPENCDVIYDQKCFRVIVQLIQRVTLPIAESICSNMGWNLANVYNETHYWMLMSYMRTKIYSDKSYFRVWTGIFFENGRIHLRSGVPITLPTTVWYPNHPNTKKHIVIDVNRNPNALTQGMFDESPKKEYHGALCELEVK
ncbi:uncharacterized protein LOC144425213 [Styela clava]